MIRLRITDEIFRSFPDVLLGIVVVQDIDNTHEQPEVMSVLREEESKIRQQFVSVPISDHPHIAPWREAYRKFGAKPKEHPSSVENLVRRVAKGHSIPHINSLVDIYNTVSLRYVVPIGGEDLESIRGDVLLTFAGTGEAPVRLLGEKEERSPQNGEVIYKDDAGAICRRWNWKEADRTKLTESTTNAFLVTEALPPVDRALTHQVIGELSDLIGKYCGGKVIAEILDIAHPIIVLLP